MLLVSDKYVGSTLSESIKELIFGFKEPEPLAWYYSDVTNMWYENKDNPYTYRNSNVKETFYFTSYPEKTSQLYKFIIEIIENELSLHNLSLAEVLIFRSNLFTRKDESYRDTYHTIHSDNPDQDCMTFLYYVETSDGSTTFFNEKYSLDLDKSELTENQTVDPVGGRFVIFDSAYYHASSSPVDHETRSVVNVIFKVK